MKQKFVYLDTEYFDSNEAEMRVVCVSMHEPYKRWSETFWTLDDMKPVMTNDIVEVAKLKAVIENYKAKGAIFCSYSVVAETRALDSLGIDVLSMKWIDLQLEYVMLLNHFEEYMYGEHYERGEVTDRKAPPPKWEQTEEEVYSSARPPRNLVGALYKMLGLKVDSEHKDQMRDLIIAGGPFDKEQEDSIITYCEDDTKYLGRLHNAIDKAILSRLEISDISLLEQEQLWRGEYAARSGLMQKFGYSIDYEATKNLSKNAKSILRAVQEDFNFQFPHLEIFKPRKGKVREVYVKKEWPIREWIKKQRHPDWMKTDTGRLSLSEEAFRKYYPFKHSYPRDNFGAQMVRFLHTKKNLNGFLPGSKKTIWDRIGRDNRIRPHMNIYGAQTGRSQPSTGAFIPSKAAWMRILLAPPPGEVMIQVDWASQEFILAALLSRDPAMIEAYQDDPYLYLAKKCRAIPPEGTKQSHPDQRALYKTLTLGISYGMGPVSLAKELNESSGYEKYTEESAQWLIDDFYRIFYVYEEWKGLILDEYNSVGYLKTLDGWVLWGDNPNPRSCLNFPVQGAGAAVMRRAVANAQDDGLNVCYTMHDSLTIQAPKEKALQAINDLTEAMADATSHYFLGTGMEHYAKCRMDVDCWGAGMEGVVLDATNGQVVCTDRYVDERSVEELYNFKKYLWPDVTENDTTAIRR